MYSGARPRKSRANTRTVQAMTPLSMPTLGPGGDFNRTASRMDPKPSRPAIGAASVYPFGRHQTIRASSQLGE